MEQTNNTTEKIIAAIDRHKVTPRPKWYFAVRNTAMWIPGVITTLLGGYTIAGVLYGVLHAHWENRQYIHYSGSLVFIAAIPLLWIISFAIFSIITISLLRKTNTGYRHTAQQLLLISIAGSIIIGILFYAFTANTITDGVETYYRHPTEHAQEYVWDDPQDGRISGVITGSAGPTTLVLRSFNGLEWNLDISTLSTDTDHTLLRKGNAIRIIGFITAGRSFTACRILPWELFPIHISTDTPSFVVPSQPSSCDQILSHMNVK